MEKVELQSDGKSVSLENVRRIIIDRRDAGEIIITERDGVLSIYGNGRVLHTEEKKSQVTRG
jgi:hypothetical protein